MKKLGLLIVFFIALLSFFVIFLYLPKSYTYKYKINNYQIVEKYNKKIKTYIFEINGNSQKYFYAVSFSYNRKRGLIKEIFSEQDCLNINTLIINNFEICKNDNSYVTNYYDNEVGGNIINTYDKIDIYELLDNNYLIWNYNGFVYINNKNIKTISLFEEDVYELDLVSKIDRFLLIPDYNQKYYFNKMLWLDSKNGSIKTIKLNRKVYYDAYILGINKKEVYLFDNNADKEYVINPFKGTIDEHRYEILQNGKWESVSLNKLKKKNLYFKNDKSFYYEVKDHLLYYVTPVNRILITNMDVSRIVESIDGNVYFIAGDSLYMANLTSGINKLMSYSEWQFNNGNIYIF